MDSLCKTLLCIKNKTTNCWLRSFIILENCAVVLKDIRYRYFDTSDATAWKGIVAKCS